MFFSKNSSPAGSIFSGALASGFAAAGLADMASASIFISWARTATTPSRRSVASRRLDGKVGMGWVGFKTPLG